VRDLSRRGAAGIIAAAFAVALGGVLFLGTDDLVRTVYFWDDEFYYFQIARNVAAGQGFTFDGVHETNGFQPLWLFLLVPVFGLAPGDDLPLRAVAVLEIGLLIAAGLWLFRVLAPRLGSSPALAAVLLIVAQPGSTKAFRVGMESSLSLCLLVIVWERWLALTGLERPPLRRWLTLGGWCSLCYLARLEAIVAVPVVLLFSRRRLRQQPAAIAALLALPVVSAVAYLAWNRLAFDTWLPISGMVKAHWAWVESPWAGSARERLLAWLRVPWVGDRLVQHVLGQPFRSPAATVVNLLLAGVALAAAWRARRYLRAGLSASRAALLLLCCALMVLVDKATLRHLLADWHAAPLFLGTALIGGILLHGTPRLARLAAAGALLACLARAPLAAWYAQRDPEEHVIHYVLQAARWLEQHTTPSERMTTWRWGGILAYFSHRRVTVLDGLPNNADFFRRVVQRGEIEAYLKGEGLSWLGAPACGPAPSFRAAFTPAQMPGGAQARLEQEFALAVAFHSERGCPGYALWRAPWRTDVGVLLPTEEQDPAGQVLLHPVGLEERGLHRLEELLESVSGARIPDAQARRPARELAQNLRELSLRMDPLQRLQ